MSNDCCLGRMLFGRLLTRQVVRERLVDCDDGRVKRRSVDGDFVGQHASDPPELWQHAKADSLQGRPHRRDLLLQNKDKEK